MGLYELKGTGICRLRPMTFSEAGLRERGDLDQLLSQYTDIVAPDTLVISHEHGRRDGRWRHVDVLAVDKLANFVVIQFKKDQVNAHMELQALRYAATASTLTFARAVAMYGAHLSRLGDETDPARALLDFIGWEEPREDEFGQEVRILLASAEFSPETTSTVLWLGENGLDIRCIQLKPYLLENRVLIDVRQVVPLPEASAFQEQVRAKQKAASGLGAKLTQYNIKVGSIAHEKVAKRWAIWHVIKGLVDAGVSPFLPEIVLRKAPRNSGRDDRD